MIQLNSMHPTERPLQVNFLELAAVFNPVASREMGIGHVDVAAAIAFIVRHLHGPLTVEELAAGLFTGRRTLDRQILSALGVSPERMITLLRLEVARQMLIRTTRSITQVALAVGFSSHAGMCNVFRRELGHSPSELRRRLAESEKFVALDESSSTFSK